MTLREQTMNKIALLPDDGMQSLSQFVDFLSFSFTKKQTEVGAAAKKGTSRKYLRGIMPGKIVMSDDFDETPECFAEYM